MRVMDAEKPEPEVLPRTNTPKPYAQFLMDQRGGEVHAELSEKLRTLIEEIEMHFNKFPGKTSGEIVIKHKIVLDRGAYKVTTEYGIKGPKAPIADQIMWLTQDGNLGTNNPRQLSMGFGKPQVVT